MKEWILAMLVIIGLLIIRDMAKTVFSGKREQAAALLPLYESHPQKERVQRLSRSFQKLADWFYELPDHRERFSEPQKQQILRQCHDSVCGQCYQRELCWEHRSRQTLEGAYGLLEAMEDGQEETVHRARNDWMSLCGRSGQFYEETRIFFQKEKQNLVWQNKMAENRQAVAQQMTEVARILDAVSRELYDIVPAQPGFAQELTRRLKKKHLMVRRIWLMEKEEGRRRIFLELRAGRGQCVTIQEVAQEVEKVCGCPMTALSDGRCTVNGDYHTIQFQEAAAYQVLYGAARAVKEGETVSGDTYSCRQDDRGRFSLCLSDGMGSGMEAGKESEQVVELLEQFMESGFSKEMGARMLNSSLVLQEEEHRFSTLDVCTLDLYTGIAEFLKAGAATTFIRRDHWVETISSTSLGVGLMQQLDYESTSRKLYHGDYVIMVTDGVLDALPGEKAEEIMKEIIISLPCEPPRELARVILKRVMAYCEYEAKDDMTVLVAGMWKK